MTSINNVSVSIQPRFWAAPKQKNTAMDFLINIEMPPTLLPTNERPYLNVALAIDVSGSMDEMISQEPSVKGPGRYELQRVYPPFADVYKSHTYENLNDVLQGVGNNMFYPMPPVVYPHPAPLGYQWVWVDGLIFSGKKFSKLDRAKEAAFAAIDALTSNDKIGVVAFNSYTHIIFESADATAENKQLCKKAISKLSAVGGTALHDGWKKAAEQVCLNLGKNTVNRVLLLTDGQASHGVMDPKTLKAHAQGLVEHGVTTSTFGMGLDFNEDLLQAMATGGDGRYYYLDKPHLIAERFAEEFSGLSQLYGRNVRLSFSCGKHISIDRVLNDCTENDGVYMLPNAIRGHNQKIVVRTNINGLHKDGCDFKVKLSLFDTDGNLQTVECSYTTPVTSIAKFKVLQENAEVGERVAELEIALQQKEAMKALDLGDFARSKTIMRDSFISASASGYNNIQAMSGKLSAFSAMADSGDRTALRKSVLYDMYETTNSRTTTT